MPKILLITNPNDDDATKYLGAWCEKIIELSIKKEDVKILALHNTQANKKELTKVIEDEKPKLILFNGHGSHDTICGFERKILIKAGDNEHLLKDKIIHTLACSSGKTLAPQCIKIGALTYIGYAEDFKLTTLGKQTNKERLQDEVANLFLEPAFAPAISLIDGSSVEEAYKKSRQLYLENFRILLASSTTEYNTSVASRLFHNIQCQVCLGDNSQKF